MDHVASVILGGGRGTRLHPLTKPRSKPAVPFGGMYRLIDIPVSNCLHSDLSKIYVVTQFNSASLNRHVSMTYAFDAFRDGFVTVLAAEQTIDTSDWLQGTADAVRKNLRHIRPSNPSDVLILSGDHIYWMDYRGMLALHRRSRADITIATYPVTIEDAKRFGIMQVNDEGRITEFKEKPESADEIKGWELSGEMFRSDGFDSEAPVVMASMGVYIIRWEAIEQLLAPNTGSDFGKHVIPSAIHSHRVYAYPFSGYWEDIGTIKSYYDANLALTDPQPRFALYDPSYRLFTRPRFLPGASMREVYLKRALVCAGSKIEHGAIEHSILGTRTISKSGVKIIDSVVCGADYFETSESLQLNREIGRPDVGIGGDTLIRKAIIDKNARIGYGVRIDPGDNVPDHDGDGYAVRDGIVIVEKDAVISDGAVLPAR
ncbi:MAG: glucose-1-phosphate adenylyltransferase [bacterium]|nr:glucose-1-phosphate adenylyltransferase [bacterium]